MNGLPSKISESFANLRKKYPFYVSLKRINSKYYVYKVSGHWDKQLKKPKTTSEYLGRMLEDGSFIEKTQRKSALDKAKELIEAKGGKVVWDAESSKAPSYSDRQEIDEKDRKILMALSMNARAPLKLIGKIAGLKPTAVAYRIEKLEKKFGIKYFAELDVTKLGFVEFVILVKFEGEMPSADEIKEALEKEPRVQLVLALVGDYDILIYYTVEADADLERSNLYRLQQNVFLEYKALWYISTFYKTYGYVKLRDQFFNILEKGVNRDTGSKYLRYNLLGREYATLRELNNDGKSKFTSIDQKYKLERGATNYTYDKLFQKGVIKRITLTMKRLQLKYLSLIYIEYIKHKDFDKSRHYLLESIITEQLPINKFALVGDCSAPAGVLLVLPVIDDNTFRKTESELKNINGVQIRIITIKEIILGEFSYRLFDNDYSNQHNVLVEGYKKPSTTKVNYHKERTRKRQMTDLRGARLNKIER